MRLLLSSCSDQSYLVMINSSPHESTAAQVSFYTPELMVCGDVTTRDIENVFNKVS